MRVQPSGGRAREGAVFSGGKSIIGGPPWRLCTCRGMGGSLPGTRLVFPVRRPFEGPQDPGRLPRASSRRSFPLPGCHPGVAWWPRTVSPEEFLPGAPCPRGGVFESGGVS